MSDRPRVVVADDDLERRSVVEEQLALRYGGDYAVMAVGIDEAADALGGNEDQRPCALVLAPRSNGGGRLLDLAKARQPQARRGVLVDWGENRVHREEIANWFAIRRIDCVVTRPLTRPDERFHRTIVEILDEWWRIHASAAAPVQVVGLPRSARTHELADMLHRHDVPHIVVDPASTRGAAALARAGAGIDVPVVALPGDRLLRDPSLVALAEALGARTQAKPGPYDLVVVGGGPGGLAAAVSGASEGLRTALIEPTAMGGQAGTSSMIRNYLGFPRGISGSELAARALEQALLFGVDMVYGHKATGLRAGPTTHRVDLDDGSCIEGRAVLIATGVSYRRIDAADATELVGRGIYYGAAAAEAHSMAGQDVLVVGGGNSAGQAAIHLAKFARQVTLVVRRQSLVDTMSTYLITELDATPNIEICFGSEVVATHGNDRLQAVDLRRLDGTTNRMDAEGLFVLIGATPFTDWIPPQVETDSYGFVVTGPSAEQPDALPFETSVKGVFAVGDVRQSSIKRVASAVGEGSMCVRLVHEHLGRPRIPALDKRPSPDSAC